MNFFKLIIIVLMIFTFSQKAMSDSHDKVKEKKKVDNTVTVDEEPLPLNDPFVGDSSLSGGSKILSASPEELENNMSLYKFKLVGVMSSENDKGFASLVDENGEVVNISLYEELSPGVKLIALNNREAVFERQENLMVINFKNQVIERAK